jgi:hypothetical protein
MSAHTGPVLTVRWAHHGRYLASGSDDTVLLIWDIDPMGGGRVFGSEEVNVENWKALRRLAGHEADVVDCAWSRDDGMLASVGLDSKIVIWDGYSFGESRKAVGEGAVTHGRTPPHYRCAPRVRQGRHLGPRWQLPRDAVGRQDGQDLEHGELAVRRDCVQAVRDVAAVDLLPPSKVSFGFLLLI